MVESKDAHGHADRKMMVRCIALSQRSHAAGEYPFGAVIARDGTIVTEAINHIARDTDVTRHAEIVAIAQAQAALGTTSLKGCTLYVNIEPCAMCSFAVRESRIDRVVFGLFSPHMGGLHKWNILGDEDISHALPEVYAPPPEIVGGFMAEEAARAIEAAAPVQWHSLISMHAIQRPRATEATHRRSGFGLMRKVASWLRRTLFDRFGRQRS